MMTPSGTTPPLPGPLPRRRRLTVRRLMLAVAVAAIILRGLEVRLGGPQPGANLDLWKVRIGAFHDRTQNNFAGAVGKGDPRSGYSQWEWIGGRCCVFVGLWSRNGGGV